MSSHLKRARALILAASALLVSGAGHAANPWPTTDWEVHCYRPTCEQWYGDDPTDPCADPSTSLEWSGYDQEVLLATEGWDGSLECRPSGGPVIAAVTKILEQASLWLKGHGFEPPLLPHPDGKYIAFVSHPFHAVSIYGAQAPADAQGNRIPRPFYVAPQPGLESLQYRALMLIGPNPEDIVHELFHAIQYNSPAWSGGYGSVAAWIEEGTAEAVGLTFAANDKRGERQYDEILHWAVAADRAYEDQFFWRRAGRKVGSADDIAYLQILLARSTLDGTRGLAGVDAVFNEVGDGLYDVVPAFFSDLSIHQDYFGSVDEIEITMPAGQSRYEEEFGSAAREVAGTAHRLRVNAGNTTGEGKALEVEITFKENLDPLHLIVDRHRYDNTAPRNLYRDLIVHGNRRDYDIVVANVAEDAESTDEQSYTLEVELREVDWCAMKASVSGDINGSYFGDVAHYSTTGGATIYGAFSNPEMIEGVAEFFGGIAEMTGGEGADEQIEQMKEEMQAGASELPRETFGLSLSDQKLDSEGEQAMAFLASGFTLEASVIGQEIPDEFTGKLPLKLLRVAPGPRAESTLDKIPFVWVEGAPGSAQLFITGNNGTLVTGRIAGTLYAEGYYKPGGAAPVITVHASFVALEGPTGCMGIDAPF